MSKEAMKLALEALELINLEFVCANGSHHAKKDRHEWDEDCPITDRWRKAITALRDALAEQPAQQKPVIRVNLDMTGAMATLPKTPSESVVEYKPYMSNVGTDANIDVEARLFQPKGTGKITLHEPAQQEPVAWMQEMPTQEGETRSVRMTTLKDHATLEWGNPIPLYTSPPAQQEPVYHLRQYGDVTKDQLDRYMATGDINPQPAQYSDIVSDGGLDPRNKFDKPAQQEPVEWGVDWGRAGDIPCVSIIKRLPDGRIEVVAVEYGPQRTWVGLTLEDMETTHWSPDFRAGAK